MNDRTIAILVFGALAAAALVMFLRERRAAAKRRAEGRAVDVSDFILFGAKAVLERDAARKAEDDPPRN